ncbi:DUF805 domain-containing protein, partial [Escherichia coli]|uniref:DUF805 domain-containing protein n=1 Tax=Escherichia coli TaxID=562 RepID=UPI001E32F402
DRNRSHWSTSKTPSYTKSVSWQHHRMFTLINAIVGAIINVIQLILGLELPYLSMLYLLATFLPVLALAIRRLHDTDRSGAWALLFFVPFIGWLVLLVFFCTEGTSGSNRYGNDPKFGSN